MSKILDLPLPSPAPRKAVEEPEILRIRAACERTGAVDLSAGIPDTPAAPAAVAAARAALENGSNTYSHPRGLPLLRELFAAKLRRDNDLDYDPETELFVTNGVTGGFAAAVMALFRPGDEVIVLEPYFGWHVKLLELAGVVCRFVRLEGETFELREDALRAALGPRTRGIVLCTPSNPSGKVLTRAELELVADVARERDLSVITDEQYEQFCFEAEHVSPATVADLRGRTLTLLGVSKSLSVTGWRIGLVAGPAALVQRVHAIHQLLYICPPTPLQHGVIGALEQGAQTQDPLDSLRHKRDLLCEALREAGFRVSTPQAGFFILAEPPPALAACDDVAMALLEQTGVGAVSGRGFYSDPRDHHMLRFCFAKALDDVVEACARLQLL